VENLAGAFIKAAFANDPTTMCIVSGCVIIIYILIIGLVNPFRQGANWKGLRVSQCANVIVLYSLVVSVVADTFSKLPLSEEEEEGVTESLKIASGFTLFFMVAFTLHSCDPLFLMCFDLGVGFKRRVQKLLRPISEPAKARILERQKTKHYWSDDTKPRPTPGELGVPAIQVLQDVIAEGCGGYDSRRRLASVARRDEWSAATRQLGLAVQLQLEAWQLETDVNATATLHTAALQPTASDSAPPTQRSTATDVTEVRTNPLQPSSSPSRLGYQPVTAASVSTLARNPLQPSSSPSRLGYQPVTAARVSTLARNPLQPSSSPLRPSDSPNVRVTQPLNLWV
jgi:hypothetical protein